MDSLELDLQKQRATELSEYWATMVDEYCVPKHRQWLIWQAKYTPEVIDRAIVALSKRLSRFGQSHMNKLDKWMYASGCMRNIAQQLAEEVANGQG
jgi:hypothetical protein